MEHVGRGLMIALGVLGVPGSTLFVHFFIDPRFASLTFCLWFFVIAPVLIDRALGDDSSL